MSEIIAAVRSEAPPAKVARVVLGAIVFSIVVAVLFKPSLDLFIFGVATGALYGLIAVGLILIYRTNRIVNFAAAGLGAVPAILAVFLNSQEGVSYWLVLPIALIEIGRAHV